ncbi:MAG: hypothetical protein KGH57_02120 [Candidatus Micrarchaeota archaeon]|nr:hypothetical protein [Candidatus Micrarchaeota archaeon]
MALQNDYMGAESGMGLDTRRPVFNDELGSRLTSTLRREYPELGGIMFKVVRESQGHVHSQDLRLMPDHKTDIVSCESAAKMHLTVLEHDGLEELRAGLFIYFHERAHSMGISSHRAAEREALKVYGDPVKPYAVHFALESLLEGRDFDLDMRIKELMFHLNDNILSRVETFEEALENGLVKNVSELDDAGWENVKSMVPKYAEFAKFLPFLATAEINL